MNDFKFDLYYSFVVFICMVFAIIGGIKKAEYNRNISTIEHENTMETLYNEFVYHCDNSGGIIYNNECISWINLYGSRYRSIMEYGSIDIQERLYNNDFYINNALGMAIHSQRKIEKLRSELTPNVELLIKEMQLIIESLLENKSDLEKIIFKGES